jgi:uncharacterized protein
MSEPLSNDLRGLRALVTGPTSGIGKDLADLFAEAGCELILVSRRIDALEDAAAGWRERFGVKVRVFASDLSAAGSAAALVSLMRANDLEPDILVNNAGYGVYGRFDQAPLIEQIGMIELHVTAATYLCHAFLPRMIARRAGGVLNVSSVGGFQPVGIENVYCATKAYLTHFSEALAEELQDTGVRVTCVCPGPTQTAFFDAPTMGLRGKPKLPRMTSRAVAKAAFDGFAAGKVLVIPGLMNQLLYWGSRLAPRSMVRRAARRFVESHKS